MSNDKEDKNLSAVTAAACVGTAVIAAVAGLELYQRTVVKDPVIIKNAMKGRSK